MKCSNCDELAVYMVTYTNSVSHSYCKSCLPAHLRVRAYNGELALPATAPAKKTRKKAASEDLQGTSEAGTSDTTESVLS